MQPPVQITYRNMELSDAVSARIHEEARKLDEFFARTTRCRVSVEAPHRHHKARELFQTPSLPDAGPRSDRFWCGGRGSKFLTVW